MTITAYNVKDGEVTFHQATRTHDEIARQLGLPRVLVSTVREVLEGTSPHSQRALKECGNTTEAAVWLAQYRHLHRIAELITLEVVAQIKEIT